MSTQGLKLFDLLDGLEMTKSQYEWLARRFENMTAKEALLFRGAMQIEQPQATCDVMQIANQLEHYELLYGAGNDFALGNFVMEHIFYPSSQTREFLDPAKVGAAYRQKDGNTFCDGNFIRLSSPLDLSQNSDPAMLPDRGDYGIRVKLASRNNMEGIWVGFPDSFMSWIGGKKALRELIVTLFPVYYERYIEVFGGGGWVLFHKPPGNDFEVYNDFNSLLVNLYRCVRDKPQELMEALRYVLNSREDFDVVRATLARDSPASDVQKAAWFYELIRYSYAAGLTSFGSQPHDMWSNFPLNCARIKELYAHDRGSDSISGRTVGGTGSKVIPNFESDDIKGG